METSQSVYGCYYNSLGLILLIKDNKSNKWGFPGGSVERGEDDVDALKREFKEETGLIIIGELKFITNQNSQAKRRSFYRIIGIKGKLLINGNSDDVAEVGYFSINEITLMDTARGVLELAKVIIK